MAAMPDTHMAFQQQSAVAFWTELQDSTPAYINRGAHQYACVRLHTAWKPKAYLLMSCHGDRNCHLIGW